MSILKPLSHFLALCDRAYAIRAVLGTGAPPTPAQVDAVRALLDIPAQPVAA